MAVRPSAKWRKKYPTYSSDYVPVSPSAKEISKSEAFKIACEEKGIKPTVRQARKYRAKTNRWAS